MLLLEQNLRAMEVARESYWSRYRATSPMKLRWRARVVRHWFHILPSENILELGAGSGIWTAHLVRTLGGRNEITAAVFNEDLALRAVERQLDNVSVVHVRNLAADLPSESFDYIVGTAILCHDLYPQNLQLIYRLLKPGGQFLFFEANYWNPQVFIKQAIPALGRWAGNAPCQIGMRKYHLMRIASNHGFCHIETVPYDIIHPRTPKFLIRWLQSAAIVFEHTPILRELCGTLYISARKPARDNSIREYPNLAEYPSLADSVSVVIPCHNEEMNVPRIVDSLLSAYGSYIHEIIIVNDNSTDRTEVVTRAAAARIPKVKLINRTPPNGVGRALRDGYAAAQGRYILSMDCDFIQLLPEFRDLFAAIAKGYDGAIGSRFSHDSVLVNYPFVKILGNRAFHALVKLLLLPRSRDLTNNLKLYKSEVFRSIDIEQPHFAANAETGLKAVLAGYLIREVPMSWINRTDDMGSSTFRTLRVAPNYFSALMKILWQALWQKRRVHSAAAASKRTAA